jgi:hypothetical protein
LALVPALLAETVSSWRASVKQLKKLSEAEIQARGWGSPPYHPLCRGQLVPLGTVEEMVPVPGLVVEQEVAPPPQI